MKLSKILCPACEAPNERNQEACKDCGASLGFPNVNLFRDPYFEEGLRKRYEEVTLELEESDRMDKLERFNQVLEAESRIIINMPIDFLKYLVENKEDYLPYQIAVLEGKRKIYQFPNDQRRSMVESAFYGTIGAKIVYAALSLSDEGLKSYGNTSVILKKKQVIARTTVFEKNSYPLYDELTDAGWKIGELPPTGHYGVWNKRAWLVVNKHQDACLNTDDLEELAKLILKTKGKKQTDDFIELHIYNKIGPQNFEKACFLSKNSHKFDKLQLQILASRLKANGTSVEGL